MPSLKLYIAILVLSQIVSNLNAQPGFSLLKDVGWINNHYKDMVIDQDTIVCYGIAASDSASNWQQSLLISKFDSLGNHLLSKLILDSLGDHLTMDKEWGKINTTSDGGYMLTAAPFSRDAGIFIKLTHDLAVEFIREYADTVNLSQFLYKRPIELSDGYLLYGSIQRPNYLLDGFIRKVDEEGHTVWFNYYGEYDYYESFKDLQPVNDSTWVAVGVSGDDLGVRVFLKLINAQGEEINSWESGIEPEIGRWIRKVFPMPDKGYLTYGINVIEIIGSTRIVQSTIAKLDSNFQTEWVQPIGRVASDNFEELWDVKRTSDGNFIGVGESVVKYLNSPDLRGAWLYKFSAEGDSIWARRDPPPIPVISGNKGFLSAVGELSSGNIIAVGKGQEGNIFSGWLVKVTPDGCLDTLCSLPTAVDDFLRPASALQLYPNPSNGIFTVTFPTLGTAEKTICRLLDTQGQEIWREERQLKSQMDFEIHSLPRGLYFLSIETQNKRWVEKVFVY